MKKLFAIGICLTLLVWFAGCQVPGGGEAFKKIGEAVEKMDEIQTQLDDIQAQLDELTENFNTLADEFDEHMEKYHKAKPKTTKKITPKPKKKKVIY